MAGGHADSAIKTSLEVDSLACTDLEPLWLQAQAVPGEAMVARLTAGCDTGQAAEEASGRAGVRRYQRVERQAPLFTVVRFDVFPGGCVTTRIRTPTAYRAEVAGSAAGLLGFTSRDQLGQALEQRSDGRLHLDPVRGR
jgi:hypothetical protein